MAKKSIEQWEQDRLYCKDFNQKFYKDAKNILLSFSEDQLISQYDKLIEEKNKIASTITPDDKDAGSNAKRNRIAEILKTLKMYSYVLNKN